MDGIARASFLSSNPVLQPLLDQSLLDFVKSKMTAVALDPITDGFIAPQETLNLKISAGAAAIPITLGTERFLIGEALVQVKGEPPLAKHIYDVVMGADPSIRKDLFLNIWLTGGAAAAPGIAERLSKDVEAYSGPEFKAKVTSLPSPETSPWVGGSILGSLSTFPSMWVTRTEYDESGPDIVFRKCF